MCHFEVSICPSAHVRWVLTRECPSNNPLHAVTEFHRAEDWPSFQRILCPHWQVVPNTPAHNAASCRTCDAEDNALALELEEARWREDEVARRDAAAIRASARYMAPEERERLFGPHRDLMSVEEVREVFGPWGESDSLDGDREEVVVGLGDDEKDGDDYYYREMQFEWDESADDLEAVDLDRDLAGVLDGISFDGPERRGSPDYTRGSMLEPAAALGFARVEEEYSPYYLGGYSVDPAADFQVAGRVWGEEEFLC